MGGMEDRAETWFRQRTSHWHDWPREQLMRWKDSQGARISAVIPARDEEATVGERRRGDRRSVHDGQAVWSTNWS